jgi:diguanylate cyclase (GGDEF)-like protein
MSVCALQDEKDVVSHKHYFLMAEDDPADAALYTLMLREALGEDYHVICVDRYSKISQALENGEFQVLILDMELPDRAGIANLTELGSQYPDLPIIVLTGTDDLDLAVMSLQEGAQDYLTKHSVTPDILARSVKYAKERKLIEEKLKTAISDISIKNDQLQVMSRHDPLTQLPNRTYLQETLSSSIARAMRKGKSLGFLFIDVDKFKKVNDTFGHFIGDEFIRQLANRLKGIVRGNDFLARIGGDEFVILTDIIDTQDDVYKLLKRIEAVFEEAFFIHTHEIDASVSVGVAYYPAAQDFDSLLKQADFAMYQAKKEVESTSSVFYTAEFKQRFERVQAIESSLSHAVNSNEFYGVFQPIHPVEDTGVIKVECLARWTHPEMGEISPVEFIPIAETTPIINAVTKLMIRQSALMSKQLKLAGYKVGRFGINISPNQIANNFFCHHLLDWISETGLKPEQISLEITERQIIEDFDRCKNTFEFLKKEGISLALDDFGLGYSSVSNLLKLPFDAIKLDRILVRDIDTHQPNQALVAGLCEMGHRMNMNIVAEGVETEAEFEMAKQLGCDYIQGYYFAKPLNMDALIAHYR